MPALTMLMYEPKNPYRIEIDPKYKEARTRQFNLLKKQELKEREEEDKPGGTNDTE